jgi:hypothetical protein
VETIIGLGEAGCKISNLFAQYPQYTTFCVDTEDKGYKNFKKIKEQASIEDYENKFRRIKFGDLPGPVCLILAGSGNITGVSLRLLESLKATELSVIYIQPDVEMLSSDAKKREFAVKNILQEYARSGVLQSITLIDNLEVERIVGDTVLSEYWDSINQAIVSTVHMMNVFEHSTPVMSTASDIPVTARIKTIGQADFETGEESLFYTLEYTREKQYLYALNEKRVDEEPGLIKRINRKIKFLSSDNIRASYSICTTKYENDYVFMTHSATIVQNKNLLS